MIDNETELKIASLIKAGDGKAARQLYDAYAGYLTGVCARYVCDDDSLKDVLQESFIKIFGSLDRFSYKGPGSLKAYLTKIAVNQSLKFLRDTCRINFVNIEDIEPEITIEEEIKDISEKEIINMIRELPPGYRMILNLYVFEEKSHKEIAKLLGIKENTSASQFHRAKKLLAHKIKEFITHNNSIRHER